MACDLPCGYLRDGRICDRINPPHSCREGMTEEQHRLWLMKTAKILADAGIGPPFGGFPADLEIATMPRAANSDVPPPPTCQEAIEAEKTPHVVYPSSRNPHVDAPMTFEDAIRELRAIDTKMTQTD